MHDLQPYDELNTATGMKLTTANAEEHSIVRLTAGSLALQLSDIADILEFSLCFAHILASFTTETSKDVAGFLFTANLGQPSGRFWEEKANAEEKDERRNLEGDWEPPDKGRTALVVGAGIFEPISNDDTKDVEGEFDSDELTSGCVVGGFGSPDRNDGVEDTSSPAVDETGKNHPGVVHGRALEGSADDSPESSECDCLDTSIFITKPTTNETTDKRSDVIDTNDSSLKKGVVDDWSALLTRIVRTFVAEFHDSLIVILGVVDTTLDEVSISILEWDGKAQELLTIIPWS